MEIRDHLRILRKRAWLVIATTLLCAGAALVASLSTTPVYQGNAKLLVVARTDRNGLSPYEGALLSQQLVKSFAEILQSRAIAEAALRLDPLPFTPQQLQAKISAEPVTETQLIDLKVEDTDPARARRLTNSVARGFLMRLPDLQSGSALKVSLVEPALRPSDPIRPRTRVNVGLGLVLGLMVGVGLAYLRAFLDRTVKTPEELELATGVPVVGSIPPFKAGKQPVPVAEQPRTPAAEAFRKLRTNFAFLGVDRQSLCCVVSSPSASDGKSTVAANLAIALAQADQRVALVDADLRKPTLHKVFRLPQRVGTTTVLLDQAAVEDAIQHLGPLLPSVLTSGQLPPNPSELLGSRRMEELMAQLRVTYDVVLIDCAPMLPVTDPMVVSRFADGILLIARAGTTSRDQAHAATAACLKAGAKVFGTVLNAASVAEGDQSAYAAYYGDRGRKPTDSELGLNLAGDGADGTPRIERGRAARHRRIRSVSGGS
jgi:tyrosine-protein kinase